jgi:DNA repair photolyase
MQDAGDRPVALGIAQRITYVNAAHLLTPASGFIKAYKFTLNPYSGCSFGCDYCYARFFASTPEEHETWGEWVRVKANAASLIAKATQARELRQRLEPGDTIYMSSVTDPYQPIEKKLGLTRSILDAMLAVQPRLTVQTRSPMAARDVDLFQQFRAIRVSISVPTDDEAVRLRYEPHAPSIAARLRLAETVAAAGVPIGIAISPMLPMQDAAAFGRRLAALNAAEYVGQGFHRMRWASWNAGTGIEALRKAKEDGWTRARFDESWAALRDALAPGQTLLRGAEGYAPPKDVYASNMG